MSAYLARGGAGAGPTGAAAADPQHDGHAGEHAAGAHAAGVQAAGPQAVQVAVVARRASRAATRAATRASCRSTTPFSRLRTGVRRAQTVAVSHVAHVAGVHAAGRHAAGVQAGTATTGPQAGTTGFGAGVQGHA